MGVMVLGISSAFIYKEFKCSELHDEWDEDLLHDCGDIDPVTGFPSRSDM